jgi:DNA polymerase
MAKSRAHGLPGGLGAIGAVLGLDVQKDKKGGALLEKFSRPRNPTQPDKRLRHTLDEFPVEAEALHAYNDTDVDAESAISRVVPDLPPLELAYWMADQAINHRGVAIDMPGVEACIDIIEACHARYEVELSALTGGTVTRASELQKLSGWLGALGVHMASMDEEATAEALRGEMLPTIARRALEIRVAVGSASVKKVFAMRNQASRAGRLHDMYTFHGAHTGRPTGGGPQPTNLPNSGPSVYTCGGCGHAYGLHAARCPWCNARRVPGQQPREWNPDAVESALEIIGTRSLELVEEFYGPDPMYVVSGCLRGLFVAAEGHELVCSDYTAIEAVGAAALAGEEWRLEVFRTHGKIYEASASTMFGVPLDVLLDWKRTTGDHHPLRKLGKVGELAFGYQGWLGAAVAFGMPGTDDEIKANILAWRWASPSIEHAWGGQSMAPSLIAFHRAAVAAGGVVLEDNPQFLRARTEAKHCKPWKRDPYLFGCEGAFIAATQQPGVEFPVYRLNGTANGLSYLMRGDAVYCLWQGERLITYHRPRLKPSKDEWRGLSMSFEGWNTNPKNGPVGWIRKDTWGGRLFENNDQAICNRIFRHATLNLEAAGYPVVMHTYDELCSEVPAGRANVAEYEALMCDVPWWAKGWPIRAAGGWIGKRYRK